MANPSFNLEILTPRKRIFSGEISSLVAPGELGYLGVLANHAPLVSTLLPGKVTLRETSGGTQVLQSLGEGLLEVYHDRVTLLLDEVGTTTPER